MIPLLICVGATKCGTSWLYEYLRHHPDCGMRAIKELRYFTAVDWGKREVQAKIVARRQAEHQGLMAEAGAQAAPHWMHEVAQDLESWRQVLLEGSIADYRDYLFSVRPGAKMVGDISPEYSRLPLERLAEIARVSPDVRFLYLVRDPLERFWSHVRMTARDRARWFQTHDPDQRAPRIARRAMAEAADLEIVESGAYRRNIAKLQATGAGRLKVMFYEEFFTDPAIAELCDYLGIGFRPGRYERRVFPGARMAFPEELRSKALAYLDEEYAAVEAYMGRLPETWHESRGAIFGTRKRVAWR